MRINTPALGLAAFTLLASPNPWLAAGASADPTDLDELIAKRVEDAIEEEKIEGLVVAIDLGGEALFERGWGRMRGGALASPDALFRAESMVEPLAGVLALALAEDGKVDLGARVSEILPEWTFDGADVTLDSLLGQTSGLAGWGKDIAEADRATTDRETLLKTVREAAFETEPGACFAYSESNFVVLAAALEKVLEMPLAEAIEGRLLARAGAESSGFGVDDAPPVLAGAPATREIKGEWVPIPDGIHGFGEDTFCSTGRDLVRLQRALASGELCGDEARRRMVTEGRLKDGTGTGYGYGVNLTRLGDQEGHTYGGSAEGTTLHVAHYGGPDLTVVVVASAMDGELIRLERDLTRLVLGLEMEEVMDLPLGDDDAERFVGKYQVGCTTYEVVAGDDEHLEIVTAGRPAVVLLHQGGGRFVSRTDSEVRYEFRSPEPDAPAAEIHIDDHGRQLVAKRFP